MELADILRVAVANKASDIHLRVGIPPMLRIHGEFVPIRDAGRLTPEEAGRLAIGLMTPAQKERFQRDKEIDLGYGVKGLGRFRVNIFQQRMTIGIVMRHIPGKILSFEELNLPSVLKKVAGMERGLVLVTGTTGSGKSTTLAALLDHVNRNRSTHILTIEDPIEFVHRDRRSIISQREIGVDTKNFANALRAALRQDPDIILVGEMRDIETVEIALNAAETGHLVMSTLHTLNAAETIARIINFFPPHQHAAVRRQLSGTLQGVISQRLVPRKGGGRLAAMEIMLSTARVRELIEDPTRTKELPDAIAAGNANYGMQTFDQSLYRSYKADLISYDEAMRFATNPDDFALKASGITSGAS